MDPLVQSAIYIQKAKVKVIFKLRIKRQGCTKLYQHYSGLLLSSRLSWLAAMMFFSSKIRLSRSNIPRHDKEITFSYLKYEMLTIFDVPFGFAQMRASRQVFHQ